MAFEETPIIGGVARAPAIIQPAQRNWNRDPGMTDLISYFDEERFAQHKNDKDKFSELTSSELDKIIEINDQCRQDFSFASRNFFWITTKDRGDVLFRLNEGQELIYDHLLRMKARGRAQKLQILKARQLGCCVSPNTKVLKSDLTYVNIDTIKVGDELVAVDEGKPFFSRKMRSATVLAVNEVHEPAFRISMDDGRELIATAEHRFLVDPDCSQSWVHVSDMSPGMSIRSIGKTWGDPELEDGWFAGLSDAEGYFRAKGRRGAEFCLAQVGGVVFDRAIAHAESRGYRYHIQTRVAKPGERQKQDVHKLVISNVSDLMRMVGVGHPSRIGIGNWWEGKEVPQRSARIVSIEPLPAQRMIDLQTSTKTFIAEGFVSHNSTLIEGLIAWRSMFFRNVNALVVSHTPGHAAYLFGIMLHIYDRMPWWLRPMCASREFKNSLWFENDVESERRRMPGLNSKVKVEAFNSRSGVGTGTSVSACHVCFAPGTLVHCTDGRLIPIQDIQYGESTVTSAGRVTSISGVYRSSRRDEVTAEITPWGCPLPLRTTLDHRIMTPNGYREAGSIKSGDWISMPVRPISSTRQCLSIERGRSDRTRYSEDMPCNFSTGWLFGLYLAEGSIAFNKKLKRYQARKVEFGVDFSEEERVVSGIRGAIGPERNIRTYRHSGSRTMSVDINDCGLSGFIDLHFGFSEEKRVPDWAWECGPDFCRGILSGYLSGDWHVAKSETGTASVSASSIRPAITIQMRDLVASLGMGWSSIFYRPSGHFYGRRCQAIWTLRFNGLVAHSAARLMGKECTQKTRDYGAKWAYASDGRSMHVQVKKVDRGFSEDFYDLEVEAEEHNFTTLQACVANSEYALVPDEDSRSVIEQDLAHALAENPETFAILESTGRGMNFAYRLWKKNVELHEQAEWETLFLPVFFERSRVAIPPPRWKPEAKEREMAVRVKTDWMRCSNPNCLQYFERYRGIVDRSGSQCTRCMEGICYAYDLSPEQMYWMQVKRKNSEKDDESRKKLLQELASTAIDCFQVSGSQLFSESERSWITSNVRPPDKLGFLDSRGKMHGCNYKVPQKISMGGDRYYPCYQPDCYEDHEFGDLNNEKPMQVWFEPELGAEYCIGADVAEGLGGEHDYSVAAVLKVNHGIPDHVVAIWRSNNIDPINFATVLNSLGRWYNEAMISPEVNRYDTTLTWLRFNLQYSNIYRWKHVDSINPNSNKLGWQTNQTSKPRLWQFMKTFLQQHLLYCYSEDFASELVTFTKEDDDSRTGGAEGESHDDVAIAVMIALYCAHETDWDENAGMVALRRPLTPDEAKWKITCQRCGFIWGSAYPPDGAIAVSMGGAIDDRSQCQRCKCRLLSATMNEEIVDQRQHVNAEKEIFRNMEDRANELFVPDYDML